MVTLSYTYEVLTDSCPQVRHLIFFFFLTFQREGGRSLKEGGRVVIGTFGVALTLRGGFVLALRGDGLTYPGQFLCVPE